MSVAIAPSPVGRYSLRSLPTPLLVRQLDALAAQELATDADVLAHLAELEVREEFLRLGFASLQDYCVRRLHMSEDRAKKRIRVCRTALAFPTIFEMIADGRLSLTAVLMLAARLMSENSESLLAEAASLSNEQLEFMLARRFPREGGSDESPALELTCGIAGSSEVEGAARPQPAPSAASVDVNATGPVRDACGQQNAPTPRPSRYAKFTPLSADCVQLRCQLSMAAYEHFQRVRALASHAVPSGNAALVIEYALKLAAALLDKRKFGKGVRTRPSNGKPNGRYVPAAVRQEVCERDGGCCAYVGPDGTRCGSEWHLEFDHVVPLAEGGQTVTSNLRPLCRRHNQLEAKRRLGAPLIAARTEQSRAEAARTKQRKAQRAAKAGAQPTPEPEVTPAPAPTEALELTPEPEAISEPAPVLTLEPAATPSSTSDPVEPSHSATNTRPDAESIRADIIAALRSLGFSIPEARRGVEITAHMHEATAAQRVHAALSRLSRASAHRVSYA
ncbi:MAG: HNH endonuclease [Candidatus Eisenbacteria bacterium]